MAITHSNYRTINAKIQISFRVKSVFPLTRPTSTKECTVVDSAAWQFVYIFVYCFNLDDFVAVLLVFVPSINQQMLWKRSFIATGFYLEIPDFKVIYLQFFLIILFRIWKYFLKTIYYDYCVYQTNSYYLHCFHYSHL